MFNNNETMTLGRARILSSENDNHISQNTNVNIRITRSQPTIQPVQQQPVLIQERGIVDLTNELDDLVERNKMLEVLLSVYEENPLRYNGYLVCESKTLITIIKTLTNADKVELMVDEESGCTGCISNAKYMSIQRILVTKNNETLDMKHGYNSIYTELIKHNISVKLCV